MKLEIGQMIKTNYNTGPYEIVKITRNCDCPHIIDVINIIDPPKSKLHIHLVVREEDGRLGWLNWFDNETLNSVRPGIKDTIILLENCKPVQQSIF
ncbi:MAG: hypothetical protein WCW77_00610 [Patescibacteria group bacterium]|jgi:hypothetical protein